MRAVGQNNTQLETQTSPSPLSATKRVVVLDLDSFRAHLGQLAKASGSNAELGRRLGVTGQFIDLLIAGRRKPGPKILKPLKARRRTVIELDVEGE